jgi:hypothetical protein
MTAEAEAASLNGFGDIASDAESLFSDAEAGKSPFDWFDDPDSSAVGDIVDAEIVDDGKSRLKSDRPEALDRDAKSGIPNIDEWMHFFSNVILRLATDWYIEMAFRGVDEDLLSEREVDKIKLDKSERDRVARPLAEYSNKAKFTRKHGRMIIASADSIDAVLQLGMWFSRVNRIAAKYKGTRNMRIRPNVVRAAPVFRPDPPVSDFDDRSNEDVSAGQSAAHGEHWRPNIAGTVFNPGG